MVLENCISMQYNRTVLLYMVLYMVLYNRTAILAVHQRYLLEYIYAGSTMVLYNRTFSIILYELCICKVHNLAL